MEKIKEDNLKSAIKNSPKGELIYCGKSNDKFTSGDIIKESSKDAIKAFNDGLFQYAWYKDDNGELFMNDSEPLPV